MEPAQRRLAADLAETEFSDLAMPLVNNWQLGRFARGRRLAKG
jgi:hypothetical protein